MNVFFSLSKLVQTFQALFVEGMKPKRTTSEKELLRILIVSDIAFFCFSPYHAFPFRVD